MSTLFFADLIPGIFRTPLKSSRILWMSCCLFILFFSDTFFMHLLTSFSRCFSSLGVLLLSSMSLRISASLIDKSSTHFCCCRCHHARFIIVVLDFARVAAGMEHDRTCLFILMWNCAPRCTSVLCSGCSSPCGRCFGSRSSPASTSQPPLQPLLPQVQGVYVQTS